MKKAVPWILVVVAIAVLVGGFFWLRYQRNQSQAQNVLRSAQVLRGDLETTVAASGNVAANHKADLRFNGVGTVAEVLVEVGDRVKAGAPLARLDTADLERAVEQSQIALEQAQINLDQIKKPATAEDLKVARAALQQASQALAVARANQASVQTSTAESIRKATETRDNARNRYTDLQTQYGVGQSIPQAWLDTAYKTYTEAQTQLDIAQGNADVQKEQADNQWLQANSAYLQAKENLRRLEEGTQPEQIRQAELQVKQAELNLKQAQERLAQATLTAPFDGVVGAVNLQAGVQAPSALPAITLVDDSIFFVNVTVDETDIGKVRPGLKVKVTLDAYPQTELAGTVETLAPTANNTGGVIAYPVKVRLAPTEQVAVRDGMTASILIEVGKTTGVLLVPNWAVRTDQTTGETYTYRLAGATPERVSITIGARNETYTEITSSLAEGDTVVLISEQRNLFEFNGPPSGIR